MDNSYFVYTDGRELVTIKRFHICIWEFSNNDTLVEFGFEIDSASILDKNFLELKMFIPWLSPTATIEDFYTKLVDTSNSRFIFNDSISKFTSLDGGENKTGVIHNFTNHELCILPVTFGEGLNDQKLIIRIDLNSYNQHKKNSGGNKPNIYCRFCIRPKKSRISLIKEGITKSTILYDIKLNQQRNIPDTSVKEILENQLCKVETCFCFNIIPNTHDLVFFDNSTLKNVRSLEYGSFKKYLGKDLLKEDDLIVVFNKQSNLDSYSFFSIFTKEHIGMDQLTVALMVNLIVGILLFIASLDVSLSLSKERFKYSLLPSFFWFAMALFVLTFCYLIQRKWKFTIKIKTRNQ